MGHNRITEALARIAVQLDWPVSVSAFNAPPENYPEGIELLGKLPGPQLPEITGTTWAVVATQHKGDHLSLGQLVACRAPYVGLIASARMVKLVLEILDPTLERYHK